MDVSLSLFSREELIATVVQDWRDGTVLMMGFMNRDALERTLQTRRVHFWSRSRNRLWEKGETSGHYLVLKDMFLDCDQDAVLVKVDPVDPTCHTGERTCFFSRIMEDGLLQSGRTSDAFGGILEQIHRTIMARKHAPHSGSYVASLFQGGLDRILKKVVEEAGEVVLGSKNDKREEVIHEVADLLFHTLVVLGYHGIGLQEVYQELATRIGKSGLRSDGTKGRHDSE